MKRTLLAAAAAAAALAVPASALGHVVVTPGEVETGSFPTFVMSVPTEEEVPTVKIKLAIPKGVTLFAVEPVPGWEISTVKAKNGRVTALVATGSLPPGFFQRFAFVAAAPAKATTLVWRAFQTYEDGKVVRWTGAKGAEEASKTHVVTASGSAHEHED
jgi:uncharacterized protein YcnI